MFLIYCKLCWIC